jgi:hypothetical protein
LKPYTIEQIGDLPVVLLTVDAHYDVQRDMPHSRVELVQVLNTMDEPVFYILDLRNLSASFDDIMAAASMGARGEGASWHHPKLRDLLWVTNANIIKASAEGLKSDTFGNVTIKLFGSTDEAIAYAQDQLDKSL